MLIRSTLGVAWGLDGSAYLIIIIMIDGRSALPSGSSQSKYSSIKSSMPATSSEPERRSVPSSLSRFMALAILASMMAALAVSMQPHRIIVLAGKRLINCRG